MIFDMTTESKKKTGNRTENRTPNQREIFMDELVCQCKVACIGIFSIGPTMFKRHSIAPNNINLGGAGGQNSEKMATWFVYGPL